MDPPQLERLTPDTWDRKGKETFTQQIKELQLSAGAEPCSVSAPGLEQKYILQFRFPVESGLGAPHFQGKV